MPIGKGNDVSIIVNDFDVYGKNEISENNSPIRFDKGIIEFKDVSYIEFDYFGQPRKTTSRGKQTNSKSTSMYYFGAGLLNGIYIEMTIEAKECLISTI